MTSWRDLASWSPSADAVHAQEVASHALAAAGGLEGACGACGATTRFAPAADAQGRREGLACAHCSCNARQRATATVLGDAVAGVPRPRIYMTEQASAFHLAMRRRHGGVRGSEYGLSPRRRLSLTLWLWRHGVPDVIRLQDATRLRLRTASMHAVVSQDVLEHVPGFRSALVEFARVLRPGGHLVLTVPFHETSHASTEVAYVDATGSTCFHGEPEIHGDPVSGGAVCYHHFGWDLLDAMREAGFADAEACRVHDPARGLPQGQWVLHATR